MPEGTKTTMWYCCSCRNGPMTVANTPVCVFCTVHVQCAHCRVENSTVRPGR
ncbi:hypothetical protein M434DRAFT_391842 [Hypoxylon sp. CO27-5]|nr:hypothetical protein M434DRAFT_391842 [Hypoxylon sp. CO27-5]